MKNKVIGIDKLSFSYSSKKTLDNISLSIDEGEYVSIIGPNGAGKSTLLKCINRILNGSDNSIELFGKPLHSYNQKQLGKIVGYLSQRREEAFPYTVYEFVLMGRYPYLTPLSRISKKDKQVVDEVLDMTGLRDFANRRVYNLSGGEKQKVFLAGTLAQQPKILLLDEPTTHLDPRYEVDIQETISTIAADHGITVLHVTHDLNHICMCSQLIVALKNGCLHSMGSPEEILTNKNLKEIFETDFLHMSHSSTEQKVILPKMRL